MSTEREMDRETIEGLIQPIENAPKMVQSSGGLSWVTLNPCSGTKVLENLCLLIEECSWLMDCIGKMGKIIVIIHR